MFNLRLQPSQKKNSLTYDEVLSKLKQKYDGYLFARKGKAMYNPFSLLNVFASSEFSSYWFATGRADCVVEFKNNVYIFEFKLTSNENAEAS